MAATRDDWRQSRSEEVHAFLTSTAYHSGRDPPYQEAAADAIGADEKLPEDACQGVLAFLQAVPAEVIRQPGRFDNAVEPPAGADIQTQMLCFAGRQP